MAQELTTKMMEPLASDKEVRPYDTVKIYATGKGGGYHAEGEELEVHPILAKSLIKNGKATEKPADKKAK